MLMQNAAGASASIQAAGLRNHRPKLDKDAKTVQLNLALNALRMIAVCGNCSIVLQGENLLAWKHVQQDLKRLRSKLR